MIDRDDLKTILRVAVHVAKVDGHFDPKERAFLTRLLDAMGLTPAERTAMLAEEAPLSELVAELRTPEARRLLVRTVSAVAAVDGFVDACEERFYGKVKSVAGHGLRMPPKTEWPAFADEVRHAFVAFGD